MTKSFELNIFNVKPCCNLPFECKTTMTWYTCYTYRKSNQRKKYRRLTE